MKWNRRRRNRKEVFPLSIQEIRGMNLFTSWTWNQGVQFFIEIAEINVMACTFVYTVGKDDCVQTQLRLTVLSAEKCRQWGNQTNLEVCQNQSPVKIARTQNTTVSSSLSPFSYPENCRRQIETSLSLSWSLSLCFTHTWLHCVQAKGFLWCHIFYFVLKYCLAACCGVCVYS